MLGSILGDIIGSRFEFMSTQERNVILFHSACSWTDDSVLTYSVSKVCSIIKEHNIIDPLLIEDLFVQEFKTVVKDFPMVGWGKGFYSWASSLNYSINNSAGNGCLMRVSPIVFYFNDLDTVLRIGRICTKVSHNHPDSYHSVDAFLEILHYLFHSISSTKVIDIFTKKEKVREITNKYNIILESVENFHQIGGYWGLAKDTLPRALSCYLEGVDYHSTIHNCIYVGSDTDTTSCIAGSLAELTYSISSQDFQQLYRYFDHLSFHIVRTLCKQYLQDEHRELLIKLFDPITIAKIKELSSYHPVNQTAQWDPLELPSDEEYYNNKPNTKNSLKSIFFNYFNKK